jgi:hypothetical protein
VYNYTGSGPTGRRTAVFRSACEMLVKYVLRTSGLNRLTPAALGSHLGITEFLAKSILESSFLTQTDVMSLCDAQSLDFGLTIRTPEGTEITFWPSENFGSPTSKDGVRPAKVQKEQPSNTPAPAEGTRTLPGLCSAEEYY